MDKILKAHGSGGKYTHDLIKNLFVKHFCNDPLSELQDSAILNFSGNKFAFTTDSHVIRPLFFPGGDIGKLAVCGTVNDLAVCGAKPLWLSCGMIIEEGFEIANLEKIVISMQKAAEESGVIIVTGDTKVVESGSADGLYINTSGVGIIPDNVELSLKNVQPGDSIIISGNIGEHASAIISAREEFNIETELESDCASLNSLTELLIKKIDTIRIMRDPTRGGLATTLNEFVENQKFGIRVFEENIPIRNEVIGLCEPLGFDPLYLANEGKLLCIVGQDDANKVLQILRSFSIGKNACIIGEVIDNPNGRVLLKTRIGSDRVLDMLTGEMLPRIC